MMNTYFISIKTAILFFPVIAIIASGGLIYFLKKKRQQVTLWQSILFYSFLFYCLCMFCLVVFPLPSIEEVATYQHAWMQIKPFGFVDDFMRETVINLENPATLITGLTQNVVLQPLFNLIMFMPFGFYCQYFFKKSLTETMGIAFLLSLFFEITQLSGLYGIYPRPYRLFDVDDLFLNTLGAIVGFLLTKVILNVIFRKKEQNKKVYLLKNKLPHA